MITAQNPLSSESRQWPINRLERRQGVADQRSIFFDVIQAIADAQGCRVPALVIDPVGYLFASGREARLPGVEQGEEGGDGLFFGHETPPYVETAEQQQKARELRAFCRWGAAPSAGFSIDPLLIGISLITVGPVWLNWLR